MALGEAEIRERLRALIEGGVLPNSQPTRLRGGLCSEEHPCIACGEIITTWQVEVEMSSLAPRGTTGAGVLIFLHSRCWRIWGREGVIENRER
jgi:hypothetical protein